MSGGAGLIEHLARKLSYLLLQGTFAWVYAASWAYSVVHRRKQPLRTVRSIAAVWWCPPDLTGSNLRLGHWRSYFERDGFVYDNFHVSSIAEAQDFAKGPWSRRYGYYRRWLVDRFRQFLKLRHYDVVWLERGFVIYPLQRAFMERCLRRMVGKVVLDCTDGSDYAKNPGLILDTLKQASGVTAGCKALYDLYRDKHPNVAWINWTIPVESYVPKSSYRFTGRPVLGWMGSPFNAAYLKALEPALAEVARATPFRLKVICREPVELRIPGVEVERHAFGEDYHRLIATFDVGLCPVLGDDLGSRGKVAMKHQEFMLCGIPQVCSPVGICEETVDGENALVARAMGDWAPAILRLLGDEELRATLGRHSRELFFRMYTYEIEYPKLREALTSLAPV